MRRGILRRRWLAGALAAGLAATAGAATAPRELALKYYEEAIAERERVGGAPVEQQDAAAYQKVVNAFRRVYTTSPQSSRADDSLLAVAEIYALMSERFGPEPYRSKAAAACRFLIRQYPHSRLGETARQALEALETPPAPAAAPAAARQSPSRVTGLRYWSFPGFTRVVVTLDSEVTPRGERIASPERYYVDLPGAKLTPELQGKTFPVDDVFVKRIRAAQTQLDVARVVLDLNGDVEHAVTTLADPPRVEIEVRKKTPAAAASVALPPPQAAQPDSRGERNLIRALGLKVGRIVIDPGHGGHDTGTIGPTGLTEKELTLDVATRLGELIAGRTGAEVVFTRTDDSFVGLEERTGLANEKRADLFLSIHANSSRLRTARGIETYYLNLTSDNDALEVAARENAAAQKSIHELQGLISKITLTEKIAESREFAGQVQRALHASLARENRTLRNRGVRQAPFVVLIGARMPSVLAEISFLSNPRDEKLLKTPAWRQRIAEALYEGLSAYSRSLSQMQVAAR